MKQPHSSNWYVFGTLQVRLPFRLQAVVARFIGDPASLAVIGSVAAANTQDRLRSISPVSDVTR